MMASMKVNAGTRLSMAVPSVAELYSIPTYPNIWAEHLFWELDLLLFRNQIFLFFYINNKTQHSTTIVRSSFLLLESSGVVVAVVNLKFLLISLHRWPGLLSSSTSTTPRASSATAVEGGKPDGSQSETDKIPIPKVIIDQDSDPNATVVEITFGDRLGALLDTMSALRNLGLNVVKANVYLDSSGKHNKFAITRADTGRKVEDPELLEAIRLTIINNLIEYHPESSSQLAMGAAFGIVPPPEQVDVDVATHISINDDGPNRSLLYVESADRPGLLVDLVKTVTDIDVAVESGEFDTEGLLAKAKFHVSYRGKPLIKPLQQVLANSLRYYLRRPMTEEASF